MKNPNFFFIQAAQKKFANMGSISLKTTRPDDETQYKQQQYYMITPAQCINEQFLIDKELVELSDQHISIYEYQSKHEISKLSSTHVTLAFESSKRMHFYFDRYGNYLSNDVKKVAKEIINFEPRLINIAISYASQFYSVANSVHNLYKQQFDKHYKPKLDELSQLHMEREKTTSDKKSSEMLNEIEQSTNEIITLLKKYQSVLLESNDNLITFFSRHLNAIKEKKAMQEKIGVKREETESKVNSKEMLAAKVSKKDDEEKRLTVASKEKSPALSKTVAVKNRISEIKQEIIILDKQLTVSRKNKKQQAAINVTLLRAANLVKKHSLYSDLFEISSNDDDVLNSIIQQRQIVKQARAELNYVIRNKSHYVHLLQDEHKAKVLIPLLKLIDLSLDDFGQALLFHCDDLLLLIHKIAPNLNLNLTIPSLRLTPLQLAYERSYWKGFSLLLEQLNCFPDCIDQKGYTLLQKSCIAQKEKPMHLLLQHGASLTRYSYEGYTAFGYLTFQPGKEPSISTLNKVIKSSSRSIFFLDLMQGARNMRGTPLSYACQQGWNKIVKFYLQNGADPTAVRETDMRTSIEIIIDKNNLEMFDYLLMHHADSVVKVFHQTLQCAQELGRSKYIDRLNSFAEQYHDDIEKIDSNQKVYTLPIGSSVAMSPGELLKRLGLS